MIPPAVAGRCRWVTALPTHTRVPSSTWASSEVVMAPRSGSSFRGVDVIGEVFLQSPGQPCW